MAEVSRHLLEAGGKRFRPTLVLACGHFGDPEDSRLVPAATAVELTHLSSLYHDDVIDEAEVRRGTGSANARWTNTVAVLAGDYLFARASELTAHLGLEATRLMARTIALLCEGQIAEVRGPGPGEDPIEHYMSVVRRKTAALISASCRLGGMLSGAGEEQSQALGRYGEKLGVAFQLADDLMDVTHDEATTGKAPGTDLREGVKTLPVLYALGSMRDSDGEMAALLRAPKLEGAEVDRALEMLRAHPAVARAGEEVASFVARAEAELAVLPDGAARCMLRDLAGMIIARTDQGLGQG